MPTFHHRISKEARRKIVDVLLRRRSMRDLARTLDISPAAVHKYVSGKTHPSDKILWRMISIATYEEKQEISTIIMRDLVEGLEEFIEWGIHSKTLTARDLEELESRLIGASLRALGEARKIIVKT
ncbi:MAG: helix-turn-helix domain-containing protein [Desulfurococcales archaeon]|nr:helix-turn-helix domain-containing protein [Desulfurococcales archaeon]